MDRLEAARASVLACAVVVLLAGWLMSVPWAAGVAQQDPAAWWAIRLGSLAGGSAAIAGLMLRRLELLWAGAAGAAVPAFFAAEVAWFLLPADIALLLLAAWWQAARPRRVNGWEQVA